MRIPRAHNATPREERKKHRSRLANEMSDQSVVFLDISDVLKG
jgi:hypothetical protein